MILSIRRPPLNAKQGADDKSKKKGRCVGYVQLFKAQSKSRGTLPRNFPSLCPIDLKNKPLCRKEGTTVTGSGRTLRAEACPSQRRCSTRVG